MWIPILAAGASALASSASQRSANKANENLAEKQNQWNVYNYKNRHQWEVEDLKAAGLNPILSAQGSAGGVPSTSHNAAKGVEYSHSANVYTNLYAAQKQASAQEAQAKAAEKQAEAALINANSAADLRRQQVSESLVLTPAREEELKSSSAAARQQIEASKAAIEIATKELADTLKTTAENRKLTKHQIMLTQENIKKIAAEARISDAELQRVLVVLANTKISEGEKNAYLKSTVGRWLLRVGFTAESIDKILKPSESLSRILNNVKGGD
ncbi:DNA pilot protein [Tortoise microvirus 50]|nr:DNA pilot protein [Tortoise microvirus 50]